MKLDICPISLKEANAFVEQHHRHHGPTVGHKFSIGLSDGEKIVGVAIVGRPVSRYLDDGWTLEVNRLCTDGARNACSMLYAAAWRAARAMGYHRLITYNPRRNPPPRAGLHPDPQRHQGRDTDTGWGQHQGGHVAVQHRPPGRAGAAGHCPDVAGAGRNGRTR